MATPRDQLAAHYEFARLAGQYYVAGRFAALSRCFPVAANLLHHSIEMFLKCALVTTMPLDELKKLGHNLVTLWDRFEKEHPDPNLAALLAAVKELDKFERLRYPDSMVMDGMQLFFVIARADFSPLPSGHEPSYHLVLEDVDTIAQIVARAAGLNAVAFTLGMSEQALQYLHLHNTHPLESGA
jgi:hypothetical protein